MKLTLPYPPSTNELRAIVRGRLVDTAISRTYKQRVRWLALAAKTKPIDGPVVVIVSLFRPRRSGDIDNRLKALLDSLTGVAYRDDGQVAELHVVRFEDKADPRVVVSIEAQAKVKPE